MLLSELNQEKQVPIIKHVTLKASPPTFIYAVSKSKKHDFNSQNLLFPIVKGGGEYRYI